MSVGQRQQFNDNLLLQVNDINRRNLELQALLASKDDQLNSANAQVRRLLQADNTSHQISVPQHQQYYNNNDDVVAQLKQARRDANSAQAQLRDRTHYFNDVYAKQEACIQDLIQKLKTASSRISPPQSLDTANSRAGSDDMDLIKANAELSRLRKSYASLQRQFEAEKKQTEQSQRFPSSAPRKLHIIYGADSDQDDEEPSTSSIKRESATTATSNPSSTSSRRAALSSTSMPPPVAIRPMPKNNTSSQISKRKPFLSSMTTPARPKVTKPARKSSTASTTKSIGRRASIQEQDELEEELEDLDMTDATFVPSSRRRTRNNSSSTKTSSKIDSSYVRQKFEFNAITHYNSNGLPGGFSSTDKSEIIDDCELWDFVAEVHNLWEEAKGECWRYEFDFKMRDKDPKCCISSKLKIEGRQSGRTSWRSGHEGKYACKNCVQEYKPCFTWDGKNYLLLPLHEEDREDRYPVKKDFEIRYWVNG